ncbi:hypothetical protein JCM10914A_24290 [Paenibacillus sp. JCM 10914]|nr:hypothetical protein [Paenibacillus sp. JCM 10914]
MINEAIKDSYEFLDKWIHPIPKTEETEANARKLRSNFFLREALTFK